MKEWRRKYPKESLKESRRIPRRNLQMHLGRKPERVPEGILERINEIIPGELNEFWEGIPEGILNVENRCMNFGELPKKSIQ